MTEEKSLKEQVEELKEWKQEQEKESPKKKKQKLPKKARVKKKDLKKGWVGVLRVDENRNITGEKQKIAGSAYSDNQGLYHATDGREILFWEGKYPIIIQKSWEKNPIHINPQEETNETYGDKYKMAKMLQDAIKQKSKSNAGSWILWIALGIGALIAINAITGGSLFG